MKKSLLATTALAALGAVAVASPASAKFEVSVNGFMEQWFGYSDNAKSANDDSDIFEQHADNEVHINFSQTLDNGIKIGGHIEFEAENAGDIDEEYLYVDGSFGRFIMGTENSADYLMHYGIKSNGIGIDEGDATLWIAGATGDLNRTNMAGINNDSNGMSYFSPRINGFQVGASYIPGVGDQNDRTPDTAGQEADGNLDNAFAVGANYMTSVDALSVKVSVGYIDAGGDSAANGDQTGLNAGLQLGFGGFTASFAYGEEENDVVNEDINNFGVSLAYNAGPAGVSVAYIRGEDSDNDLQQDSVELGASYKVGPGVTAAGSIYFVEGTDGANTVADGIAAVAGLKLSF
jgi:outer membrane protein OmpU